MPIKKRSIYREGITSRVLLVMEELVASRKVSTETELISQMNITHTTLYRWRARRHAPTIENIAFLCQRFGVSPAFIILGRGRMMTTENDLQTELDAIFTRVRELSGQIEQLARQKNGKTHSGTSENTQGVKRKGLKIKAG